MEEILSSIKRIIAEDAEKAVSHRLNKGRSLSRQDGGRRETERESHRKAVIATMAGDAHGDSLSADSRIYTDEVLELTETLPHADVPQVARPQNSPMPQAGDVSPALIPAASAMSPEALIEAIARADKAAAPVTAPAEAYGDDEGAMPRDAVPDEQPQEHIVSVESENAARSSLAALSSMVVKSSEQGEGNTLEGLVREMLRPMLKDWLDANLPHMVEGMVAREIARITGRPL